MSFRSVGASAEGMMALTWRHSASSGTRSTSGLWYSSRSSANRRLEYTRQHTPGCTRPARPRRCLAAARETQVSWRHERPRWGS